MSKDQPTALERMEAELNLLRDDILDDRSALIDESDMVTYASRVEAIADSLRRAQEVTARLGSWLSAALDDPDVCAEMKADIDAWLESAS